MLTILCSEFHIRKEHWCSETKKFSVIFSFSYPISLAVYNDLNIYEEIILTYTKNLS